MRRSTAGGTSVLKLWTVHFGRGKSWGKAERTGEGSAVQKIRVLRRLRKRPMAGPWYWINPRAEQGSLSVPIRVPISSNSLGVCWLSSLSVKQES